VVGSRLGTVILVCALTGTLWCLAPVGDATGAGVVTDGPAHPGNGTDADEAAAVDRARIAAVYPNPATAGDSGEFVTVVFPSGVNLTEYQLADDHATVSLAPPATNGTNVTGTTLTVSDPPTEQVTFSTDPGQTEWLTDGTVAPLNDRLQLANSGGSLRLLRSGEVVDRIQYGSASESDVYYPTPGEWRPLGNTDRPVVTAGKGTVEAFVLPDEPNRAVEFLDSATERVLLAGYTISSEAVVEALAAAIERGVDVEVLADGSPVGGMTGDMAAALSELDRAGATVRVLAGNRERYRHHHAKYAVVDSRALVTTENWKPAGTGGKGSRGWAVITDQRPVVEGLVETFRADIGWVDAVPWARYDPELVDGDRSTGGYPASFETREVTVERTQLLVTPDNAGRVIRQRIRDAEDSLDIKQVSIGGRSFPFLQAVLDAARRGVEVRILLSSAWYVAEENRQLAAWLSDQAAAADLPLSVRLATPAGAFEKIHAKGMIVDGEQALVGSINWNENSVQNNREVALLLEGEAAGYFREVFEADWQRDDSGDGGELSVPLGVGLAVIAVAVAALLAAKRIRFD
jgi:phosphatidylserine/phosphatidylglycerophosphate/cardiolipin synthase-like enzyme